MDQYKQEIHELKRSLEIERSNVEYMSAELEMIHSSHDREKRDLSKKHVLELDRLRRQMEEMKNQAQSQEENYLSEISTLKQKIGSLQTSLASQSVSPPKHDVSDSNIHSELLQTLQESLSHAKEDYARLTDDNTLLRSRLDNATEKVQCLEETLQNKREELAERDQTLDQQQDTIHELRAELMQLRSDPDPESNKKGNSLFAEVDDQRQQVIHILGAQNRSFKEMKRAYRQSEAEIRQLKEENALMVREIGKIKSIFLSANRSHAEQLTKRIADLQRDSEKWRQKVHFLEGQVTDGKVSAVLEFCRNETDLVRQELNQSRMQKCELNELLHAAQEELAQWRFQCLKQKCVLIDREMRLEAHNIAFESRCAVPVDETVHVSVDEWQDEADEAADGRCERRKRQQQAIIPEILELSLEDEPDAMELVSIIKLPVGEEGEALRTANGSMEEQIPVEIKAEPHSPENEGLQSDERKGEEAVKQELGAAGLIENEEEEMLLEDKRNSKRLQREIEDVDCEIVPGPMAEQDSIIDLCAAEATGIFSASRPVSAAAVVKEEWLDMSLEVASHVAGMDVSPTMDNCSATRKAMDVELLGDERRWRSEKLWTPSPLSSPAAAAAATANEPINLDFLLDSPNKPQHQQPILLDCCTLESETGEEDSNKENEKRKTGGYGKGGGLTKLSYKPINSRKSILVKRNGLLDNNQKNVHFASDVKDLNSEGGSEKKNVKLEVNASDRPKKKITVNIRNIHSRSVDK